jgi:hypothetical protein
MAAATRLRDAVPIVHLLRPVHRHHDAQPRIHQAPRAIFVQQDPVRDDPHRPD